MGDFDRRYSTERRYSAAAAEYDRAYRSEFRGSRSGAGERRLEIVKSNAFGSGHSCYDRDSPPRPWRPSPDPSFPPLPARRGRKAKSSVWGFSDPEMKRRRRVAGYKAYGVEGKLKASMRKGFRWIKAKCSDLVHGW